MCPVLASLRRVIIDKRRRCDKISSRTTHALLPRTEREVVNLASMAASELVVGARNHTQFIVAVTVDDLAHTGTRVSVVSYSFM